MMWVCPNCNYEDVVDKSWILERLEKIFIINKPKWKYLSSEELREYINGIVDGVEKLISEIKERE